MNWHQKIQKIPPLNLVEFVAAQTLFPKLFWKCRLTGKEIVCLGASKEWFHVPENPLEKVYGAIAFPGGIRSCLWQDFHPTYFFLPTVEIEQTQEETLLKIRGTPSLLPPAPLLNPSSLEIHSHLPSYSLWEQGVETVLADPHLQKVVLARQSTFISKDPPYFWLKKLKENALHSTVFGFQPSPSSLFLGASPEMLYQRQGRRLQTESLAGTRKKTEEENQLKESVKDIQEFLYVKEFLCRCLDNLCSEGSFSEKDTTIETSHLRHLYNRFSGVLKEEISDADLLKSLHPTPAVGGLPRKEAIEKISLIEPFDRGLYAGVLGSISPLEASFAVTIRSALLKEGFLHAFAGTGIVQGSHPQGEWEELEAKLLQWSL